MLNRKRGRKAFGRFRAGENGAVMIEFVAVLPVLALMLLATIEFSLYTWTRNRAFDAAAAVGDLATQALTVDDASIETFYVAADAMLDEVGLTENGVDEFEVRLTSAVACRCSAGSEDMCFRTLWSHFRVRNGVLQDGYALGQPLPEIPEDLAIAPGDTVIMAEYRYVYEPVLQFILETASFEFEDEVYYRPRASLRVSHVGSQEMNPSITCDVDGLFDLPPGI